MYFRKRLVHVCFVRDDMGHLHGEACLVKFKYLVKHFHFFFARLNIFLKNTRNAHYPFDLISFFQKKFFLTPATHPFNALVSCVFRSLVIINPSKAIHCFFLFSYMHESNTKMTPFPIFLLTTQMTSYRKSAGVRCGRGGIGRRARFRF